MRDAVHQRVGLSGARSADDEPRIADLPVGEVNAVLDCDTLSVVQFFHMRRIHPRLPRIRLRIHNHRLHCPRRCVAGSKALRRNMLRG